MKEAFPHPFNLGELIRELVRKQRLADNERGREVDPSNDPFYTPFLKEYKEGVDTEIVLFEPPK